MTDQGASPQTSPGSAVADFTRMFRQEVGYVWHCLRRLGIPERDLEDAVQDVFVVIHRHLADYDPSRPLRPWVCGIAYRVASDYRRRAPVRREVLADPPETSAEGGNPEMLAVDQDARRLVHAALAELPFEQRCVLVLHDLEGHSMPELVTVLEAPLATLYSRLRLARERFANAVRKRQSNGGAP